MTYLAASRNLVQAAARLNAAAAAPLGLGGSPLARRIIVVNLIGLMIVGMGAFSLAYLREGLVQQRERALTETVHLLADLLSEGTLADAAQRIGGLALPDGAGITLFDPAGRLIGAEGRAPGLDGIRLAAFAGAAMAPTDAPPAMNGRDAEGRTFFLTAAPLVRDGGVTGLLALSSAAGEIDALARQERDRLLRVILVAALVSLGLSLVLASAIATPLARLATAAEAGRTSHRRGAARVQLPDLGPRADEIGRLSSALRTMVAALYQRLETNEQFAADVTHELKNPIASLRSAVSTMRVMRSEESREKLIAVVEHDARRLDRLVSDIASAARLDSDLVREEEEEFDLARMLERLAAHFRQTGAAEGIRVEADLPRGPIRLTGLEPRLAQVFVNLLTNALSFTGPGDRVLIWCRCREDRVLIGVDDSGPGIPAESLDRIFQRFYSERPASQFGEHSGLGLSISRQIVEAHGGAIWAENLRPPDADGPPTGARFVVSLRL